MLMKQEALTQKNTLLKAAKGNAATKAFKRVFFSPPQIKLFFKISHRLKKFLKPNRTVLTLTDIALNVNRLEQSVCGLQTVVLRTDSKPAGNIKIKRNLKKKGFGGLSKCVQVMKCVQVQKNATEESGVNDFNYLLHFFAGTVVLSIPSFFYFVNPFFVIRHPLRQCEYELSEF